MLFALSQWPFRFKGRLCHGRGASLSRSYSQIDALDVDLVKKQHIDFCPMLRGLRVWRRFSIVSCSPYDSEGPNEYSYLTTKDHGLHKLGLCRACSKLDWQEMDYWDGYVLMRNHWEILTTRFRCRFCAFVYQSFLDVRHTDGSDASTRQSSFMHVMARIDIPRSTKLPLRLTVRGGVLNVRVDIASIPGLLASFQLYCDPGTSPNFIAKLH